MRVATALLFCVLSTPAHSFQITCNDVRAFVARHGKAKALAFAISNGATLAQIRDAKRCLATTTPAEPRAF